jgi:hypothetical protein
MISTPWPPRYSPFRRLLRRPLSYILPAFPSRLPSIHSLDRFSLTDRGMALYSLCTDLVEMVVGESRSASLPLLSTSHP